MFRNIKSFFKVLSEDEIEAKELVEKQASRRDRRVAEKVASQVIDLVETNINAPIVIDVNEIGDIVRNSFNEVIADFLPVTTSTCHHSKAGELERYRSPLWSV